MATEAAPLIGMWGAPQVQLTLTEHGGTLQRDCGQTVFPGPIQPGFDGHFTARGQSETYQPGPTRADETAPSTAVTINGHVEGSVLTLSIAQGTAKPAVVRLEANRRVKLMRCL